jgi:hypothetical protein
MIKIASFPRAAPVIAVTILILSAIGQAHDIELWNKTCGARVRTYDVWTELTSGGDLRTPIPFLLVSFLALVVPVSLVRSRLARNTTLSSMSVLLFCAVVYIFNAWSSNYHDECYKGGHENGPGEALVIVLLPGILISILNAIVLVIDLTVGIAKGFLSRRQGFS